MNQTWKTTTAAAILLVSTGAILTYTWGATALLALELPTLARAAAIIALLLIGTAVFASAGQALNTSLRWLRYHQ